MSVGNGGNNSNSVRVTRNRNNHTVNNNSTISNNTINNNNTVSKNTITNNHTNPTNETQLYNLYRRIEAIDSHILKLCKNKLTLIDQLYDLVHEPTEKLGQQLLQTLKSGKGNNSQSLSLSLPNNSYFYYHTGFGRKKSKGKNSQLRKALPSAIQIKRHLNGRFTNNGQNQSGMSGGRGAHNTQNQLNQPKYCYCSQPSYGQMVMCDELLCKREWFHVACIGGESLKEKWYCKDCRKLNGKVIKVDSPAQTQKDGLEASQHKANKTSVTKGPYKKSRSNSKPTKGASKLAAKKKDLKKNKNKTQTKSRQRVKKNVKGNKKGKKDGKRVRNVKKTKPIQKAKKQNNNQRGRNQYS